jgi:hypothetical protein
MAYQRLGAVVLFVFILSNAPLPAPAYATCCGCACTPWMGCTCRGYTDPSTGQFCPRCHSNEPVFQAKLWMVGPEPHVTLYNESEKLSAQSHVIEQVLELMGGGKCLDKKVALRLLGTAHDNYVPVRFEKE